MTKLGSDILCCDWVLSFRDRDLRLNCCRAKDREESLGWGETLREAWALVWLRVGLKVLKDLCLG